MKKFTTRQECAVLKAKSSAQAQKKSNYWLVCQEKKDVTTFETAFQFAFPFYTLFEADTTFWAGNQEQKLPAKISFMTQFI